MVYSDTTLTEKTAVLKAALDKTEALIIGAGAGLSTAAGLAYDNTDTFNALFPGYLTATACNLSVRPIFTSSPPPV
jgi:NAD-dependent SIR2 family protein deacetylase